MSLPVIVCLKSAYNNKYLCYQYEDVQSHGLVHCEGDNVMDPYVQFEVEESKTHEGLVHLKCRFNNKYLVRWSVNHYWITASAHKINEDKGNWTCTLFKPCYVDDGNKIRFLHYQLGHYASLATLNANSKSCLFAASSNTAQDLSDVFTYMNWESLFQYPKQVAFKAKNGKYLGPSTKDSGPAYLQFVYDDPNDPKVAHEVSVSPYGAVFIKSNHYGKFWRHGDDDWIVADLDDPRGSTNATAMFRPDVMDINVVAYLNMAKTWFINRFTSGGVENGLCTMAQNVDDTAVFEVIDLGTK